MATVEAQVCTRSAANVQDSLAAMPSAKNCVIA